VLSQLLGRWECPIKSIHLFNTPDISPSPMLGLTAYTDAKRFVFSYHQINGLGYADSPDPTTATFNHSFGIFS
jgi:hypothetical protein